MGNKSTSATRASEYLRYKSERRWEKNRLKRLASALKRNPGNLQIKALLDSGGLSYRRATPKSKVWSKSDRLHAQLLKQFKLTIVSKAGPPTSKASMFSIKERVRWI